MQIQMKYPAFFFLFLVAFNSCAQNDDKEPVSNKKLPTFAARLLNKPELSAASTGIAVYDFQNDSMIFSLNAGKTLIPASTQKLLVAAAALELFGPGHRFKTFLEYDGTIQDGVLNGNLMIRGGGDPSLGSDRFGQKNGDVIRQLTDAAIRAGIRKIEGDIKGDASLFGRPQIPDTWIWEDIGNYYGSPAFGLNIYENIYRVHFRSGNPGTLTEIIAIDPPLPGIDFNNRVTAAGNNRDNAYIFGSYLSHKREIRGTIPANRDDFTIKGAIPDPALLLAGQLTEDLMEAGIEVSGNPVSNYLSEVTSNREIIFTIESAPLAELNEHLLKSSINLYAESFLMHLSRAAGKITEVDTACSVLKKFWQQKGMDVQGMFPEDGSGLSRANGLTANQLLFVLKYMKTKSSHKKTFLNALSVAGVSGNLKYFGRKTELQGRFTAKSGYMTRVMNYAGYMTTDSGRDIAVVVLVNNYSCQGSQMRNFLEQFLIDVHQNF